MNEERVKYLVRLFNEGKLDKSGQKELEILIRKGRVSAENIDSLKDLLDRLDDLKIPEPGPEMDRLFYERLKNEKTIQETNLYSIIRTWMERIFPAGYSYGFIRPAIMLFAGFLAGYLIFHTGYRKHLEVMDNEIREMHEMLVVNLLQKPEASDRLKAVNLTDRMTQVDSTVIRALLNTLDHDENVNVRLAAINALLKYSNHPEVRQGLVESLSFQDSPLVLVTLADAMVLLQQKNSVGKLKDLLKDKNLNQEVRDKIIDSIHKIS